jgi:hypothetical protein
MRVHESFYRGEELGRVRRSMPAQTYNMARLLVSRAHEAFVFVPIRSMQYLAIIEADEFNFVHSETRRQIDISWQSFGVAERTALDQPVSYDFAYYSDQAPITMQRLQGELLSALKLLAARTAPANTGAVLQLRRR